MIFESPSDLADDAIYAGELGEGGAGGVSQVRAVVRGGLGTAEGLAVDWVGGTLYWVQAGLDLLEAARLDGSCRQTVVAGGMSRPRALALDPASTLLFWTDWDPVIKRYIAAKNLILIFFAFYISTDNMFL